MKHIFFPDSYYIDGNYPWNTSEYLHDNGTVLHFTSSWYVQIKNSYFNTQGCNIRAVTRK